MRTLDQALTNAAAALDNSRAICRTMTAREQATAAWTPGGPPLAELEARIRAQRGMPLPETA